MSTITEVIEYLRRDNKVYDFEYYDDRFICEETGENFQPEELTIKKTYRFEGDSSADDMSILYFMEAMSGTKGVFADAFGMYADEKISDFISKIPDESRTNK